MSSTYCILPDLKVHAFVLLLLVVSSCAQKKKQNAKNHYHLAMIELSENNQGIGKACATDTRSFARNGCPICRTGYFGTLIGA